MARKVYCMRYGAYGDMMYLLPTLDRLRANGDELFLFTGIKGREIYMHDHRFAGKLFTDDSAGMDKINVHLGKHIEQVDPDVIYDFSATLEGSLIYQENHPPYHWPLPKRRNLNKDLNFYDIPMIVAEVDNPKQQPGECGAMSFHEEEIRWAESWRKMFKDKFIICMPLEGSMGQKRFVLAKDLAKRIYKYFEDAVIFPMGDKITLINRRFGTGNGRTYYPENGYSMRQSILMTRYADYVIGPETGLLVAAGMWGTPKTMMCTSSSISQCVGPQLNDFSLQAEIDCAPCLRAIYGPKDCHREKECDPDETCPCNYKFDLEQIVESIGMVYGKMRYVPERDEELRTGLVRVSEVQPCVMLGTDKEGPIQPGVPGDL